MTRRSRMSFRAAMDLVPDDMPDGAFWAMAHEFAGLDYGDGFEELLDEPSLTRKQRREKPVDRGEKVERKPTGFKGQEHKPFRCCTCNRRFRLETGARDHWRQMHGGGQ